MMAKYKYRSKTPLEAFPPKKIQNEKQETLFQKRPRNILKKQ